MQAPIIELVVQTEAENCTSACLAMLLHKDIDIITKEFHADYKDQNNEVHSYLASHLLPFRHCKAAERKLKPGYVYMMCVPSVNIECGNHCLIIEMTDDGDNWFIFDPNNGRSGRKSYGPDFNLVGWSPDYEFSKNHLLTYWNK